MSKTTRKTVKNVKESAKASPQVEPKIEFPHALTQKEIHAEVTKAIPKPADRANEYSEKFLESMVSLLDDTRESFAMSDVFFFTNMRGVPIENAQKLFQIWKEKMIFFGKIEECFGCMDTPIYIKKRL